MPHLIRYNGTRAECDAAALQDCRDYLGDGFDRLVLSIRASCEPGGEFADRRRTMQFRLIRAALDMFLGISGRYPVRAMIRAASTAHYFRDAADAADAIQRADDLADAAELAAGEAYAADDDYHAADRLAVRLTGDVGIAADGEALRLRDIAQGKHADAARLADESAAASRRADAARLYLQTH